MPAIIGFVVFAVSVVIWIYLLSLAGRLVNAVERIADSIDKSNPPRVSARIVEDE